MLVITARNVNDAFHEAMWKLPVYGIEETSRNGKVLTVPTPVTTHYLKPTERMLFHAKRDANPFFHVMEAMWMLAGRNDVATVARYAKNMKNYSDDSLNLSGAYGYRWRHYFGIDQIMWVIQHLRSHPDSRRAVITMWDAPNDCELVDSNSLDVPCNTTIYFRKVNNKLDMTVCCRSNDVVWGCYGANAVHMSYLQEFVAQGIGLEVGSYFQVSNNWHIYEPHFHLLKAQKDEDSDLYLSSICSTHIPLLSDSHPALFLMEVEGLLGWNGLDTAPPKLTSTYLRKVVVPLMNAWQFHKENNAKRAWTSAIAIRDEAVSIACTRWLDRRAK